MLCMNIQSEDSRLLISILESLEVTVDSYIPNVPGSTHRCYERLGKYTYRIPGQFALKQKWCRTRDLVAENDGEALSRNGFVRNTAVSNDVGSYVFSAAMDPRRGQVRARRRVIQRLESKGAGLLSLPCGGGKTVVALSLLQHPWLNLHYQSENRVKVLVLCHKTWLLDQWEERIKEFVKVVQKNDRGDPRERPVSIGRYQGSRDDCDWGTFDVICASLSTVFRRIEAKKATVQQLYAPSQENPFLIIIDETHHISAPTFLKAFKMIKARRGTYVLGLSATPRRKDGLDIFLRHCFGDPFVVPKIGSSVSRIQSVGRNTSPGSANADIPLQVPALPRTVVEYVAHPFGTPMKMNRRTRKPDFNLFLRDIVDSQEQLRMMANYVKRESRDPLTTGVLVLSDRVQHLKHMKRLLQGEDAILLYGGQTKKQKEAGLRFENRITLSTFSFLSEGVDVRRLNVLIFLTPKRDIEQAAGRVARARSQVWAQTYTAIRKNIFIANKISSETVDRIAKKITYYAVNYKALLIDFDQCGYAKRDRMALYRKKQMQIRELYYRS